MNAPQWERIKRVVAGAMEVPVTERAAFVERACGSDRSLRLEVESLLAAHDSSGGLSVVRDAIAHATTALIEERDASVRAVLEKGLGHQYEIIRPLGKGGMGEVYLARERALERMVAIKVLRPDLALTPESRERFRREARTAAQLTHRGIVGLHTFGEVGGVWFFVMEYVRGETLAERLRRQGRIGADETCEILIEIADALECAHERGIVHRDIKPANILLEDQSGRTVLADFGIAKSGDAADEITATGAVIGTPDYMAPEQAMGTAGVDVRSDIYSLGVVAYAMLAGRGPFASSFTTSGSRHRNISQDPSQLVLVQPSVPEELADVVMKCLARDPALRWSSAKTLKEALVRAGGDIEAIPEPIRQLPSFGPYALAWAIAWSAIALFTIRSPGERILLLLVAILVPTGLLMHVWHSGGSEVRFRELLRVAWWPPEWWGMWWPRPLRRPADVWSRMPWPARLVRTVVSAFFLAVPAVIILRQQLGPEDVDATADAHQWLDVTQWFLVFGLVGVIGVSVWWARRLGFSFPDATRFLFGATLASRFWSTPNVTRLLAAPRGRVRAPDRDSPADHHRAIDEVVRLLPARLRDEGEMSSRAAESALAAIEAHDRELEGLTRDADIAVPERLSAQLALLGEPKPDEAEERRELRALLQNQLAVASRVREKSEAARVSRERQVELLRTLWTQICVVQQTHLDAELELAVARLREICGERAERRD